MGRYSKTANYLKIDELPAERRQVSPDAHGTSRTPVRVHSIERRLGRERIQQIVQDYESGIPTTELVKHYKLGKGTVIGLLRKHGAAMRNQPLTPEQTDEAVQLYLSGSSLAKVGRHFRREPTVIRDILKCRGITRRDSHGRER